MIKKGANQKDKDNETLKVSSTTLITLILSLDRFRNSRFDLEKYFRASNRTKISTTVFHKQKLLDQGCNPHIKQLKQTVDLVPVVCYLTISLFSGWKTLASARVFECSWVCERQRTRYVIVDIEFEFEFESEH